MKQINKMEKGITLIALVITIVILIILATISINVALNGGLIFRSQEADEKYRIGDAREKLTLVLAHASVEKRINKDYNQNEFLNSFIKDKLPDAKINGNYVIVDGYAFELDRSEPKIGEYKGNGNEMIFPNVTVDVKISDDLESATLTIKAQEDKKGINKIEVFHEGTKIKEYTYSNDKDLITETLDVEENGRYEIKVYAEYEVIENKKVEGIAETSNIVTYTPNGNSEYKKEHSVKVSIDNSAGEIKTSKYQWLQTTDKPAEDTFTQTFNNGDTLTKNDGTGTWYLWTLVETQSGEKSITKSKAFNFDNEGPTATLDYKTESGTLFKLKATATKKYVEIAKYEFFVNNVSKGSVETSATSAELPIDMGTAGEYNCYVVVTVTLGNASTSATIKASTQMYTWEKWKAVETSRYYVKENVPGTFEDTYDY